MVSEVVNIGENARKPDHGELVESTSEKHDTASLALPDYIKYTADMIQQNRPVTVALDSVNSMASPVLTSSSQDSIHKPGLGVSALPLSSDAVCAN